MLLEINFTDFADSTVRVQRMTDLYFVSISLNCHNKGSEVMFAVYFVKILVPIMTLAVHADNRFQIKI